MDSYITRQIEKRLLRLADHFPVIVVTGARQVGKTTLLRHLFSEADHVTFDPTVDVENARADPDLFLDNHREPLVLDEIQYAPEVVSAIKRRVKARRQFSGQDPSSARSRASRVCLSAVPCIRASASWAPRRMRGRDSDSI